MGKAEQLVAEIIGDGNLFEEGRKEDKADNAATKRPGPFAQDLSREPPTKEERENDYRPEKRVTGNAAKR